MKCTRKADKNVRPTGRVGAMVAVQAAALLGAADVWAGVAFDPNTSTLRITHDADISNPNDTPFIKNPSTVPPSTTLFPVNSYQMNNHTFTSGNSSTIAAGSLGHVTNSTTASFVLAPGTGVTQNDPDGAYPGSSSLKFNMDLRWDVTTGGFGPLANGYASLAVGGTVGDGGSATVRVHLVFRNQSGDELRTPWDTEVTYGPGTFTDVLTTARALNAPDSSLPAGSKLRVSGSVEFLASNELGPTSINPIRAEFGGAPPTAHFKIDRDGSYFDPTNWEPASPDEEGLLALANAAGERAVFFGTTGNKVGHVVSLGSTVTLGTLDIGGNSPYTFSNGDSGRFEFRTRSGNAVINARGNGLQHVVQVPVEIAESVDLSTDALASIGFADTINGAGTIHKFGPGAAIFAASNANFVGNINVLEGTLRGNAFRSLGLGQVVVAGGDLEYGAGGASGQGVIVKTGLLNVLGVDEADHFEIQQGGAIGGDPEKVSSLRVGQNLALNAGAMIVHGDPTNVQNGNPQLLGNDPLYIFGVAGGLPVGEMAIGSASGTPWVGIGGSRGANEFGSSTGLVTVLGAAVLTSLPGGSLDVQSKLLGTDGTLTKMGDGSVRLSNTNPFSGLVNVNAGALLVNGSIGGDVIVKSGGTLGGEGAVIGTLQATEDGSAVAPGDGGIGTLSVGKLQLGQVTTLSMDLDSPNSSDQILIRGDLVLDGQLFIEASDNFGPGRYPIMQYGGTLTDNGLEFAFVPEGLVFDIVVEPNGGGIGGIEGLLAPAASGGTVFLVVVPEPTSIALIGVVAVGLMRRRRR